MIILIRAGRQTTSRGAPSICRCFSLQKFALPRAVRLSQRHLHISSRRLAAQENEANVRDVSDANFWKEYRRSFSNVPSSTFPSEGPIPVELVNTEVAIVGFLTKVTRLSKALSFANVHLGNRDSVQILIRNPVGPDALESIRLHSAISVTGIVQLKHKPKKAQKNKSESKVVEPGKIALESVEIDATTITCLNTFDASIHYGPQHIYPPSNRHLQFRFDHKLRDSIVFRAEVAGYVRTALKGFHEIETPVLFKSTPEGAREFLVPTRKAGFAYALPQSPQQYKQMLMASGFNKYFQFARCFRDEDLRADRQPEFTQIDIEMAWTDGEGVMQNIEKLIKDIYRQFAGKLPVIPYSDPFHRMTYVDAMSYHGSDKPDLRIPGLIHQISEIVPASLRSMITSLENPIIEACKVRFNAGPEEINNFMRDFFDSAEGEPFQNNPNGGPGIAIYDPQKPLEGLQVFGFEGAEQLKNLYSILEKQDVQSNHEHETATSFDSGDLIIFQARPDLPHTGGSTALGNLRRAIYKAAVGEGLIEPDTNHRYLWITDFPMFTLEDGTDPGQGGTSGFSATHHPFTAPKTASDVDLLLTDPLKAKADHYDLVVNGVELGGGSRRIHNAEMQKFIMTDVLKMSAERVNDFSHLLKALSAGCPPHAGFALGFDRLMAVLCGVESIRDVIAFPKNSQGDDLMVSSPRRVEEKELGRYHLQIIPGKEVVGQC